MNYPVEIQNMPITPFLDGICASLLKSKNRAIVLSAETAAGKSTALPVALLSHIKGKILMLEPRRLAAVAIASRVAEILGEDVGQTAGYTLHLESKKSKATRLEVVTEAILTRRLQADPLLEGISAIVIDEFHERSVHADLALAFLKETMEIRDDLFLVVMSATMNCRSVADYLGADIVEIPGRRFPVDIEYTTESVEQCVSRIANSDDHSLVYPQFDHKNVDKLWITPKNSVNSVEKSGKNARYDTILEFLPGIGEMTRAKRELEEEIGYRPGKIKSIGAYYSSPGFCNEIIHLYLATELANVGQHPDEDEFVNNVKMPFSEVLKLVLDGTIKDGKTIAAILKAKLILNL